MRASAYPLQSAVPAEALTGGLPGPGELPFFLRACGLVGLRRPQCRQSGEGTKSRDQRITRTYGKRGAPPASTRCPRVEHAVSGSANPMSTAATVPVAVPEPRRRCCYAVLQRGWGRIRGGSFGRRYERFRSAFPMRKRNGCSPFVDRFDPRRRPSVLLPRPSGLGFGRGGPRRVAHRGRVDPRSSAGPGDPLTSERFPPTGCAARRGSSHRPRHGPGGRTGVHPAWATNRAMLRPAWLRQRHRQEPAYLTRLLLRRHISSASLSRRSAPIA